MNKLLLGVLTLLMCVGCVEETTSGVDQSAYPEFSWDTVPVAIHFSQRKGDFTQEETDFLAQFPLICVEKHQGSAKYGDVRIGAKVAAEALKKANPNTTVLFYWNSRIDNGENYFGHFILDEEHHPEWALRDLEGKNVTIRGVQNTYDATVPEFRDWWVSIPTEVLEQNGDTFGGVFVDAMPQHLRDRELAEASWGVEKVLGVRAGVDKMLESLNESVGDDKIIIANNIHAIRDFDTGIHKHIDGGMIEHFCDRANYTLEEMAEQIEIVQDAARRGRITMVKCWPRYSFRRSHEYKGKSVEELHNDTKADIDFPLSCFLVAAGKYSYFLYSWGYHEHHGNFFDYPEYHKPLGEPEGEAVRDGWKYSRRFEHAYVTMDLETRTGNIEWF